MVWIESVIVATLCVYQAKKERESHKGKLSGHVPPRLNNGLWNVPTLLLRDAALRCQVRAEFTAEYHRFPPNTELDPRP